MGATIELRPAASNPRAARTIGALNLVFGLGLLLCMGGYGYFTFQPEPFERVSTDPGEWGLGDPWLDGWLVADVVSAGLLDLALIVSGVGLIRLKRWGRLLAVWVAGLKIARLAFLIPFFILVLEPQMARLSAEWALEEERAQAGGQVTGGLSAREYTQLFGALYTGFDVAMLLLGPIYPAIILYVLTRPGVRAATSGAGLVSEVRRGDDGVMRP